MALKHYIACDVFVYPDGVDRSDFHHMELFNIENFSSRTGADAIVISGIKREGNKAHEGAASHYFFSVDGQNERKPIPASELFSVFCSMADHQLERSNSLSDWQVDILNYVVNKARENILAGKGW